MFAERMETIVNWLDERIGHNSLGERVVKISALEIIRLRRTLNKLKLDMIDKGV